MIERVTTGWLFVCIHRDPMNLLQYMFHPGIHFSLDFVVPPPRFASGESV
jgi:hypothetical protein